jgi:hypothetical protein
MLSAIGLMLAVQPGVLRRAKLFNAFGVVGFLISPQIRNAATLITAFSSFDLPRGGIELLRDSLRPKASTITA